MRFDDYSDYDALGLAALIEQREITATNAVNAAIERIERHNPQLNAVVHKAYDEARTSAKVPNKGSFLGVPTLIKDLGLNLPDGGDYAVGFVCDHVLTRTVRDSAAMLDATGMPERGSPYAIPHKRSLYIHDVERVPGRLRIHWSSDTVIGGPVHPEVQEVLERTASTLAALGHIVIPGGLAIDEVAIAQARLPVSGANFAAFMRRMIGDVGREPERGELEPMTSAALKLSRQITGEMALYGFQELRRLSRLIVQQFETIDVYLTPVMTSPPPRIGTIDSVSRSAPETDRLQTALYPYALIFNFTGQPSMSLPVGRSAAGLPIGMMLTARYGDEATLFTLAGQLEKEMPWAGRRPPVWN